MKTWVVMLSVGLRSGDNGEGLAALLGTLECATTVLVAKWWKTYDLRWMELPTGMVWVGVTQQPGI
jgi:hypothetical protein